MHFAGPKRASRHALTSGVLNMPFIPWPGELLTGHPMIDADHEHLVGIVNRLADAVARDDSDDDVGTTLCELADYTREHFEREEHYMERIRHPDAEGHKLNHGDILSALSRVALDYELGHAVRADLLALLAHWITDHIMRYDKRLAAD